ncbi:MAG: AAA family ATPase, partial [Desulfotomaculaceae bacterium]|nr:AAA family ATPase [Desulfotomaculaceae bacterium]
MNIYDRLRVPAGKLRRVCSQEELDFCKSTQEVSPLDGFIVQERTARSLQFGLSMSAPGYNIFVVGPPGTGKSTYTQAIVEQTARGGNVPKDWCYINNFTDQDRPVAVSLPAGEGRGFQRDMEELLEDLRLAIPKAYESGEFEQQKNAIVRAVQQEMEGRFRALGREATVAGFDMKQMPRGLGFIPLKEGKPLSGEEFGELPDQERQEIEKKGLGLKKKLDETIRTGQALEKQANEKIKDLEQQITLSAADPLINKLVEKYRGFPPIVSFLKDCLQDISKNSDAYRGQGTDQPPPVMPVPPQFQQEEADFFNRYRVN